MGQTKKNGNGDADSAQRNITVFLVDDHAMVREGLASLFRNHDHITVVGQCGDGSQAVRQICRVSPDVAVVDIQMPGMNGLDACRKLAGKAPKVGVLILTMHDDEQFVIEALSLGARGYLLKESAGEHLEEAILAVASGKKYLGPGIPLRVLEEASRGYRDSYEELTEREREVLKGVVESKTNRQIASELGISPKTVDTYRTRLMNKLNIHDQVGLTKYYLKRNSL